MVVAPPPSLSAPNCTELPSQKKSSPEVMRCVVSARSYKTTEVIEYCAGSATSIHEPSRPLTVRHSVRVLPSTAFASG